MSYILEALKESQRSREEQRVPDIGTPHGGAEPEREPPRRAPWPWALAVLVLIAAGAGWWLAGRQGPDEMAFPVEQVQTSVTVSEGAAANRDIPVAENKAQRSLDEGQTIQPVAQEAEGEPAPLPAAVEKEKAPVVVAEEPAATGGKSAVGEAEETVTRVVEPPVDDAASVTRLPEPVEPAPVVLGEPSVTEADTAPSVVPALEQAVEGIAAPDGDIPEAPASEPVQKTQVAQEAVAEVERVPHYRELPFDVQRAVGDVKYSVHLYSPNPERRLVKINGLVYREGAEVSPGLVLEQVVPDGAIFTYREYRFWVPVR